MVTRLVDLASQLTTSATTSPLDLLILGAGWTSTFLIPLLSERSISHAATSTTGRDGTIPFRFDPASDDTEPFRALPTAKTVLITFPLKGQGESKKLIDLYTRSRQGSSSNSAEAGTSISTLYIQLGSTGIFTAPHWNTHTSSYDTNNARAQAEDELLSLSGKHNVTSTVLNLAGLYGGQRDPKAWLPRVIKTKEDIAGKKALHLVHGADVARAIVAAHLRGDKVSGQRWIINDLHVYDWWELIYEWAGLGSERSHMELSVSAPADMLRHDQAGGNTQQGLGKVQVNLQQAVLEYMGEFGVRALPRGPETLGRVLDGRDFWREVGSWPSIGRVT